MNCYSDLTRLKSTSYLNLSSTDHDTYLVEVLAAASRQIDKFCARKFYPETATKYFNGAVELHIDDLLSIDTFKLDIDGDGTFSYTLATSDYILYPLNVYPKVEIKINRNQGDYSNFASGIEKGVEIIGLWNYAESATPYSSSGTTITASDGSTTAVTAADGTALAIGQTVLVESEQMYISAISDNNLTVKRAVNGTTGAAHSAKTAYIYEYPEPIVHAVLIQAMRWWKRKDSAFQDTVAIPETGQVVAYKGLDSDVKLIIDQYRRLVFA